jgi:hypothetical protein
MKPEIKKATVHAAMAAKERSVEKSIFCPSEPRRSF